MAVITLLTRAGCAKCDAARAELREVCTEFGAVFAEVDVDAEAAAGDPELRGEFGDRLPVVLFDGTEHSYWDVDVPHLRQDLSSR